MHGTEAYGSVAAVRKRLVTGVSKAKGFLKFAGGNRLLPFRKGVAGVLVAGLIYAGGIGMSISVNGLPGHSIMSGYLHTRMGRVGLCGSKVSSI